MPNLVEGLLQANEKSREFLKELDDTAVVLGHKSAMDDPGLAISYVITHSLVKSTDKAIGSGDVLEMLAAASAHGLGTPAEEA